MNENVNIIQLYTYALFGQVHTKSGSLNQPYHYVGGDFYYTEEEINLARTIPNIEIGEEL